MKQQQKQGAIVPVNMDPSKKRIKKTEPAAAGADAPAQNVESRADNMETPTERDKELALADAEWKNLWDATEVIDMDKW